MLALSSQNNSNESKSLSQTKKNLKTKRIQSNHKKVLSSTQPIFSSLTTAHSENASPPLVNASFCFSVPSLNPINSLSSR